jgi:hypothetical protein
VMVNFDQESEKDSVTIHLIKKLLDMSEEQQLSLLRQLDETSVINQSSNDRDDNRKNFKEMIHFTVKGRNYTGISEDISSGGMFIKTEDSFSVGQSVIINIPLTKKQKHIKVPAEIVRVMPEGIGVEFLKKIE